MTRIDRGRCLLLLVAIGCLTVSSSRLRISAQAQPPPPERGRSRNYDARISYNAAYQPPSPLRDVTVNFARQTSADARVTFDGGTGAMRTLVADVGFLTGPDTTRSAQQVALDYVRANVTSFGLDARDLDDFETTDFVVDQATGASHLYLRQRYAGIPVYNGQLQVNVNREGRILGVNNAFHPGLTGAIRNTAPTISADGAVLSAARHLEIVDPAAPRITNAASGDQLRTGLDAPGISRDAVTAQLMWLTIRRDDVRLVWNFQVATTDGQHIYDMNVDATSGDVWTRFDWVAADQYKVYPLPAESPNHVSPVPPSDGRTIVTNPANATASPFGWQDTDGVAGADFTIMRGNNVHAYDDSANQNAPPASQPDCGGSINCNFPIDLTADPSGSKPAAIANLFYLNNMVHDIQYQYGFTETAGNFQSNNYGRGGLGNDYVQAEAQDGGGTNNANFGTPPDGSRPRMQMYLFTLTNPKRDGDLDAGVVVHEYGHGISNRLVGGPSNVSCLSNAQEAGEGLSDWWAMAYTARVADTGPLARGMGTYVLGQPTTGAGIRRKPYSTNAAVNNYTYATVGTSAEVHDLGEVWAEAAWRVYWALVNQYGFDPNLYNAAGNAGNQRMMLYVNAGLMDTACSPAFTDIRDGIIQAATDNHGGQDVCLIWQTFAAYGLGLDAISGGPNGVHPLNRYAIPISCGGTPQPPSFANQPAAVESNVGANAQFGVAAFGNPIPTYQWQVSSNGGTSWTNLTNTPPYSGTTAATLMLTNIPSASLEGALYRTVASNSSGSVNSNAAMLTFANSTYSSTFKAPYCSSTPNGSCSSGALLVGRANIAGGGVELNQPNTIANSCADGPYGQYQYDESLEKLKVSTLDGTPIAPGKTIKIEATAYVWYAPYDALDLYYSASATSPVWQFIATITPPGNGYQTMSAQYTLPAGATTQAVRGVFRYNYYAASSCGINTGYDDYDDLVFSTCGWGLSTVGQTFGNAGGTGSVAVTTQSGCTWSVSNMPAWASTTSGGSGTDSGLWNYSITPNGGSLRTQSLTIAGTPFVLTELGAPTKTSVAGRGSQFSLADASAENWTSIDVVGGRSYCAQLAAAPTEQSRATPSVFALRSDGSTQLAGGSGATRACFIAPASETALFKVTQTDVSSHAYLLNVVETTLWADWFYSGGDYSGYIIVRNTSNATVNATITWRGTNGAAAGSQAVAIPAGGVKFYDARAMAPGVAIGSIEIGHDGEPNALVGSATTLSPTTGLSFDTIIRSRGQK